MSFLCFRVLSQRYNKDHVNRRAGALTRVLLFLVVVTIIVVLVAFTGTTGRPGLENAAQDWMRGDVLLDPRARLVEVATFSFRHVAQRLLQATARSDAYMPPRRRIDDEEVVEDRISFRGESGGHSGGRGRGR